MNVWDAALKKGSFQHTRATRRWSSATSGVQNVLLVHGHTTLDVDATVWWPGRWSRGQTTATLEETFSRHLFLARSSRRINAIPHSWRRSPDLVWLKSGSCLTTWSSTGPSNSGVHVYGRVSVNKEDILNTRCSWTSPSCGSCMLETSFLQCCISNVHKSDKFTNISKRR